MNKLPPEALEVMGMMQRTWAQKMLPDEDFFKHFADAEDHAKEQIEHHKEAMHCFYLYGRNRDETEDGDAKYALTMAVMADWPPENKYQAMQGLGAKYVDDNPDYMLMQIVHVSEAWFANYLDEEKRLDNSPYLPKGVLYPSERPDKKECLVVHSMSMDQRINARNTEIVRRTNSGKFKKWGEVIESLYDPKAPAVDPTNNMVDYLSVNILMGYFKASEAVRNTDE